MNWTLVLTTFTRVIAIATLKIVEKAFLNIFHTAMYFQESPMYSHDDNIFSNAALRFCCSVQSKIHFFYRSATSYCVNLTVTSSRLFFQALYKICNCLTRRKIRYETTEKYSYKERRVASSSAVNKYKFYIQIRFHF